VYRWIRDDGTSGNVLVDETSGVARPCDEDGIVVGDMAVDRHSGTVANPDPVTKGRFVAAAAAIFQDWQRSGALPDVVSRNF
jgi:hypothetical protein